MLDTLTDGFSSALSKVKGKTRLTEDNIQSAIDSIRKSLLDADVEYSVTKDFISKVKEKALGQEVKLKAGAGSEKVKVSTGDHFIKICQEELTDLMGPVDANLEFPTNRPAIVMMVGLQGAGKTTSAGKLTKYLMEKKGRKPLLVAADIYRPAAVEQLKVLGQRLDVPVYHQADTSPVEICNQAVKEAFKQNKDTIIFDTAGRLTIDDALMAELDQIKEKTKPDHIMLVCDAMMGQDAVTTAKAFHDRLSLSGVIMTKLDGDARGGAALSVKQVIGTPIKFLGMGEELDRFEEFRPEGLATRILGMGDIVGLMEDFERVASEDAEKDAMRMLKGQFTFKDFYDQISMIQKMGSVKDILGKLPMASGLKDLDVQDGELNKIKVIIDSMTKQERTRPDILNDSRIRRVSRGCGRTVTDIQELLKKFKNMRSMMGNLGKSMGLLGKIPGAGGLAQMGQMKKMAQQMMGGQGLPGGMGMPGLPGMASPTGNAKKPINRDRLKKLRKREKAARKKNRKR